jgi:hypothetical protein
LSKWKRKKEKERREEKKREEEEKKEAHLFEVPHSEGEGRASHGEEAGGLGEVGLKDQLVATIIVGRITTPVVG